MERTTRSTTAPLSRLLGDVHLEGAEVSSSSRPLRRPLSWDRLARTPAISLELPAVAVPSAPPSRSDVRVRLAFQSPDDGPYDVQWIACGGSDLDAGDLLVAGYRVADGKRVEQRAPCELHIVEPLVVRNTKVWRGDPVLLGEVPGVALDLQAMGVATREDLLRLAQAVNAAVKGFMGSVGQSGQIVKSTTPIKVQLHPERGFEHLLDEMVEATAARLIAGDVLAVSEKVIAIALGRLFPLSVLYECDPKVIPVEQRAGLLDKVRRYVPDIEWKQIVCADSILDSPDGPMATAGVPDANGIAFQISKRILESTGMPIDVVVSDTDTGLDIQERLINCITLGATPLGATAGLSIYDCMRVANAAEFTRGATQGIPLVICEPHLRCRKRDAVGEFRGYTGWLDAEREGRIGFE